ncbi:MAG: phospholipid carrier-dependent glycosyltransferase, partial [Chloroflexota bacterium]|nr:phospholipid carrier-dependent glycosyltransferase [Chloroflexota bacterium]
MTRADWIALLLVTLGGGIARFARLGRPGDLVFDEIFYARNACWYVHASPSICGVDGLVSRAHPPLGNWLIGTGILVGGYDAFGWRLAAAAAGTLTIALLFILAHRLTGSTRLATVAAALMAIDFLHFVHSRVAMLDVFVTLFGVTAFLFAVVDHQRASSTRRTWWERAALGRPW